MKVNIKLSALSLLTVFILTACGTNSTNQDISSAAKTDSTTTAQTDNLKSEIKITEPTKENTSSVNFYNPIKLDSKEILEPKKDELVKAAQAEYQGNDFDSVVNNNSFYDVGTI